MQGWQVAQKKMCQVVKLCCSSSFFNNTMVMYMWIYVQKNELNHFYLQLLVFLRKEEVMIQVN